MDDPCMDGSYCGALHPTAAIGLCMPQCYGELDCPNISSGFEATTTCSPILRFRFSSTCKASAARQSRTKYARLCVRLHSTD